MSSSNENSDESCLKRRRSSSIDTSSSSSSSASASREVSEEDISVAIQGIEALSQNLAVYRSKELRDLRAAAHPFFSRQGVGNAFQGSAEQTLALTSPKGVDARTIVRVLLHFEAVLSEDGQEGARAFRERKALRRSLCRLADAVRVQESNNNNNNNSNHHPAKVREVSLENKISDSLNKKRFGDAYTLLLRLATSAEEQRARSSLKLGTLQRWVREADVLSRVKAEAGTAGRELPDADVARLMNTSWLLLDLVLRVMDCREASTSSKSSSSTAAYGLQMLAEVRRRPPFDVLAASNHPPASSSDGVCSLRIDAAFRDGVKVVHHVAGKDRRPPAQHDLKIYSTAPGLLGLRRGAAAASRSDVLGVPGAFVITDILSVSECLAFITAAEAIGYQPDAVEGIDNITWLADSSISGEIYDRAKPFLHPLCGRAPVGLNPRLRLFRYYSETTYRPHIDGSWVEAGIDPSGVFREDLHGLGSERTSRFTFLLYLNDDFEGGGTTFFLPAADTVGAVDATSVRPRRGCALVFPHGSAERPLVHEGSELGAGVKYVVRTDVIYDCSGGQRVRED